MGLWIGCVLKRCAPHSPRFYKHSYFDGLMVGLRFVAGGYLGDGPFGVLGD